MNWKCRSFLVTVLQIIVVCLFITLSAKYSIAFINPILNIWTTSIIVLLKKAAQWLLIRDKFSNLLPVKFVYNSWKDPCNKHVSHAVAAVPFFILLYPPPRSHLRQEFAAVQSVSHQSHVVFSRGHLSLHHPGHQSPSTVRHTCGA